VFEEMTNASVLSEKKSPLGIHLYKTLREDASCVSKRDLAKNFMMRLGQVCKGA
jgi:hypothetical protein